MQVLPRRHTDARTYNMVVTVCVKAADLPQVRTARLGMSWRLCSPLAGRVCSVVRTAAATASERACMLSRTLPSFQGR